MDTARADVDLRSTDRLAPTVAMAWLATTPMGRPVGRVVDRYGWPRLLLGALMAVSFLFFTVHVRLRQDRFGTFDHDLGIWDQNVWLLSRGESFNTVRGLDVFAFHVSPALFLFVPFYWLGAGPDFLDVFMIAMLTLGAIPVFRATDHYLRNQWYALVVAAAFVVNYAGQWMLHETFHPEVVAITPLLFAYLAAIERRWAPYALWLIFAVSWKEDVAIAAFMLGFLLLIRRERRIGGATMAAAAIWFVIATQVIVPALSPEGGFTEQLFGDLGSSAPEIAETSVTQPDLVWQHLDRADSLGYFRDLLASYGFVGLLSPAGLLIGLPQALINLLAIHDFFWTTRVHYAAIPLASVTIATIEGVARPRRAAWRRFLLGAIAVGAVGTSIGWGVSLFSPAFDRGYWPRTEGPNQGLYEAAVAVPDDSESVSASYNLVPHLSHRSNIYTFPNPWRHQNWGVHGEGQHDPNTVDVLILDTSLLNPEDCELLHRILGGTYGVAWEIDTGQVACAGEPPVTDPVIVARRAD